MTEFKAWPKIGRRTKSFYCTITEKMDGTNSCIIIEDGKITGVQSRKRLITPGKETDNYGFAGWVERNEEELLGLGDGYHYGEWVGLGINKNRHGFEDKRLYLFNTKRWNPDNPNLPDICYVVPVLFEGQYLDMEYDPMQHLLDERKGYKPEGIVIYFPAFDSMIKETYEFSEGKWKL